MSSLLCYYIFLIKWKQMRRIPFWNWLSFIVKIYLNWCGLLLETFHCCMDTFNSECLLTYLVVTGYCFGLETTSSLGPWFTVPVFLPLLMPVMLPAAEPAQLWIIIIKKMNGSAFSGTISCCCLRCNRDDPYLLPATIATESTMSWLSRIMNIAFAGLFKILRYPEMALTVHSAVWTRRYELCMLYGRNSGSG